MMFQKDDILTRQTKDGETIWINQRLLISEANISDNYLRRIRSSYKKSVQACYQHHNILPENGKSWRFGKINGQIYFDLKCLPNRFPNFIRNLFGNAKLVSASFKNDLVF